MAFEQELLELLPRLRRFARSLTRDINDADDLCQMALERALNKRHQWQAGTRLDSWMYRITRNIWIDTVRAAGRREHVANDDAMENIAGDDHLRMESRMELKDVDRAMDRLPIEQREAVSLVLVEGFAYKEAAALLDIPIGTLTSRLVRGREALQRELGEAA
jgi:RNA polymerase sigma-70 factor (ECF subfamily)